MANSYYTFAPSFIPGTKVRSDEMNLQLAAIEGGFDLLPTNFDAINTGTATFAPETGSGNAYVVTMPTTRTSNTDGDEIVFFATHTNTASPTLNVDGIGAAAIVRADGGVVASGDMNDGLCYAVRYDAANARFQIMSALVSDTGLGVSQTPWTSNINAAGFDLDNVTSVEIKSPNTTYSHTLTTNDSGWGELRSGAVGNGFYIYDAGDVGAYNSVAMSNPPVSTDSGAVTFSFWEPGFDGYLGGVGFESAGNMNLSSSVRGANMALNVQQTDGTFLTPLQIDTDAETMALSNFVLDLSQVVGVGQDNYVLTYDDALGTIQLEAIPAGGGEVNDLSAAVTWVDIPIANVPTGVTGSTVALGNHTHLLATGATDVTATVAEVNLLDLAGLTSGWVLSADTATTASWKAPVAGAETNDLTVAVTWANIPIANVPTGTTGSTVALGNHTHLLAAGATDVTATATEVNLLDLSGLTTGWVLSADSATTASWKAPTGGSQTPWSSDIDGGGFGLDNIDRLEIQAPGVPGDSVTMTHDGTDFSHLYAGTDDVAFTGASGFYTFSGTVYALDGASLRAEEFSGTDYIGMRHDGTNGEIAVTAGNIIFDNGQGWNSTTEAIAGNAATLSYEEGNAFQVDLAAATGNVTITLGGQEPANGDYGIMEVKVQQDSVARTITWAGGTFVWVGGTQHTQNPTVNTGISIYVFETWDNGTTWYASGVDYG
jgi:hypothetical protein